MPAIFTIKDNSNSVLHELQRKRQNVLEAWGMTAERYAKRDCPVNTGRLRNSLTYATRTTQSQANTDAGEKATAQEYKKQEVPETNAVYIGSNVSYLPAQEFRDMAHRVGKAHFIRDSVANHVNEYEEITKAALQQ